MKTFRTIVFWLHLLTGATVGLVVAMMSITGVALAFQPQILEWQRRGLSELTPPPEAQPLPLEELLEQARSARPELKATALTLESSPNSAVLVRYGRADRAYLDPWTGEEIPDPAAGWASFFGTMTSWHRWLAMEGEKRPWGRGITGASNAAFAFLAVSGLYLWFPRRWRWNAVRQVLWFRPGAKGKARDWNWHHVIGFWTLPVLVVLTVSGMIISYPWAVRLLYSVTGDEQPKTTVRVAPIEVEVPPPPPGSAPLPLDRLVAKAREEVPGAASVTLSLNPTEPAAHLSIRERDPFPLFEFQRLALDPHTGEVLHLSGYEELEPAAKIRWWLRFLHTGEALGWPGQLAALVASLGGVFLVWTGLALAWRRYAAFRRRRSVAAMAAAEEQVL